MQQQIFSASYAEQFSMQPDFVTIIASAAIGPVRVLVPDGAIVEYIHCFFEKPGRYYVFVYINDAWVGFHCGERTSEAVHFSRESDAQRLCDVRNAAWAARRSDVEVA